jgi:hypothetical protein
MKRFSGVTSKILIDCSPPSRQPRRTHACIKPPAGDVLLDYNDAVQISSRHQGEGSKGAVAFREPDRISKDLS